MDCNNNDGNNYVYQMQQTMNLTLNGMTLVNNNAPPNSMNGANNMQPNHQTINYDKKYNHIQNNNNLVYLNGHQSTASNLQPINNVVNGNNNLPAQQPPSNNLPAPPQQQQPNNGQFSNGGLQSHTVSPPATRLNQYSDYNSYNGSTNYYNNYDRNPHYNQTPNTMNHMNQIQAKDRQLNYLPPSDEHSNHQMYNNLNQQHLPNNVHSAPQNSLTNSLPVRQPSQVAHLPAQNLQQPSSIPPHQPHPLHPPATSSNQPPSSANHNHIQQQQSHNMNPNVNHANHINHVNHVNSNISYNPHNPPINYQQQPSHSYNSNNLPMNNSGFNNQYDQNYYNNINNGSYNEQWRYQQQNHQTPQQLPPSNSSPQLQMNNSLNQQQQHKVQNLNNSANLSQPYSSMHISSPMNGMNGMDQQQQLNHSNNQQLPNTFHPNQANQPNYIGMNGLNSNYPLNQNVDNQHVQHHPSYLASPPPLNAQQANQQPIPNQYHQMQSDSSPLLNNNNNHPPPPQRNAQPINHKKSQQTSSQSSIEQALESVVNGTKQRRKRGKGKATKNKVKREQKVTSAYALFFKEVQPQIKKSTPELSFGEISKTVAHQWSCLPEEHKQSYKLITDKERTVKLEELAKKKTMAASSGCLNDAKIKLEDC